MLGLLQGQCALYRVEQFYQTIETIHSLTHSLAARVKYLQVKLSHNSSVLGNPDVTFVYLNSQSFSIELNWRAEGLYPFRFLTTGLECALLGESAVASKKVTHFIQDQLSFGNEESRYIVRHT